MGGIAYVHGGVVGEEAIPLCVETGKPCEEARLEAAYRDSEVFGNWTTPIAGMIRARQLVAQMRIKPVNFMIRTDE